MLFLLNFQEGKVSPHNFCLCTTNEIIRAQKGKKIAVSLHTGSSRDIPSSHIIDPDPTHQIAKESFISGANSQGNPNKKGRKERLRVQSWLCPGPAQVPCTSSGGLQICHKVQKAIWHIKHICTFLWVSCTGAQRPDPASMAAEGNISVPLSLADTEVLRRGEDGPGTSGPGRGCAEVVQMQVGSLGLLPHYPGEGSPGLMVAAPNFC